MYQPTFAPIAQGASNSLSIDTTVMSYCLWSLDSSYIGLWPQWKTTPAFPNQPEALASCKNTTEANFAGLPWEGGKSCVPTSYVDSWSIGDGATSTLLLLALFFWSHASPEEVKACETFCNLGQITSFAHLMTKLCHEGRSKKVKAPTAALCGYIAKLGTPEIHAFPTEIKQVQRILGFDNFEP